MSKFFDETMQGLLEAIAIEKGNIPLIEKKGMPAPTFYVEDRGKQLIDEMIVIRKELKISQRQLAQLTGNKQQAISRMESKEHSPTLKSFCNMMYALGYELKIVKIEDK